jgi:uroporphyrinogen-III decarboxylase
VSLEHLARMRDWNGDLLILWGSVSVSDVLLHGSTEDVRAEVERCIDACCGRSGFFLAPTGTVGPDVPEANILALYEHGLAYGSARRTGPVSTTSCATPS